ncbi:hypothetical protein DXB98_01765 [Collinsella sp. OM07-12]|nr:hypothetical protein DXB98_01765 [Collinsella sp. OM07-12]
MRGRLGRGATAQELRRAHQTSLLHKLPKGLAHMALEQGRRIIWTQAKRCRHPLEGARGKLAIDIAEHSCHQGSGPCRTVRHAAHQLALVTIHELGQKQLKQTQDDFGAVGARVVQLAEHLLHVAPHAPALAATKAHVPAMVGLAVERVEQKPRDRALAREARLQAPAQKCT